MIIALSILGWTFFACAFLGMLWFAHEVFTESRLGGVLTTIAVVSLFMFLGLGIGDKVYSPRLYFELSKEEWVCTSSHSEVVPIMIGKITSFTTDNVCDQYTRIRM